MDSKNKQTSFIVCRWCNPCRMLTPRIESVIAERKGEVILAKVDIDEHSDLALDYDVSIVLIWGIIFSSYM